MSLEKQPFISIVIANYNYGRFLEEAIKSVLQQCDEEMRFSTGEQIELIIVDGGSTDNSVDIIQAFSDRLCGVRFSGISKIRESTTANDANLANENNSRTCFLWCSEPDKGQSDAFNKGFSHATGRFLTWLNADDVFLPGALERARREISRYPECEWFVGGCFWLDPDMRVIKCSGARPFSMARAVRNVISVWAPSSFFAKALLDRVGGVDIDFHYMMDTELWHRFHRQAGVIYRPIKGYCWGLRVHPAAKMSWQLIGESIHSQPNWARIQDEGDRFLRRYGPSRLTRVISWLTTPPLLFLRNKVDSWRFARRHYKDCVSS